MKLDELILKRDVKELCYYFFNVELTDGQIDIVRIVAFDEHPKVSICAMTRYGKSYCVALGVGLYILINTNKKISFIAPTKEQAGILRDYMADLIVTCDALSNKAHLEIRSQSNQTKAERLKQEASKNRVTFNNGCEYRIFTAANDGRALMGFGVGGNGGKIIKDEATKLSDSANTKISRMIGDNPENTQEIELFNPWDRDNRAFEHYVSEDWHKISIGWQQALKEKRTTKLFIDQQRRELTPLEFEVLYDSVFPKQSEDSIFNLSKINQAENRTSFYEAIKKEIEILQEPAKYSESVYNLAKAKLKEFRFIISCDVADKGLDETVIYSGFRRGNYYEVLDYYHEPQTDNSDLANRIFRMIKERVIYNLPVEVNIDGIGVGVGVVSRVKELLNTSTLKNVTIRSCGFGNSAMDKERYLNKKAENYFRLRALFIDENIKITQIKKLKSELMKMKWKFNSGGKVYIVDPEKSPDYSDSLVYFVWKGTEDLVVDWV